DAGPSATDGGAGTDAGSDDGGTSDATVEPDAGTTAPGGSGCDCQVAPSPASAWPALLVLAWLRRRVSGGCR
ncbi:MAG: hypothetical protein GWO04_43525, partial [Actinobacteria bacterium]|nr:hypothetical protein [Actinomycetota bacterium]